MPLISDDENAEAERLALEAADRQFQQRLAAANEARRLRQQEAERIREAQALLERADPNLLAAERYRKAVGGVDLRDQKCAAPSLGGQTPQNMQLLARQEAAREQTEANEQASRKRWLSEQADVIERLCAGQEPSQQAAIRAAYRAQVKG